MIARRLVGSLLTLMAVQYAALGAGSLCAAEHAPAGSTHVADMAHDASTTPDGPCAPAQQDSQSHHVPAGCLAMAGCMAWGITTVVPPRVTAVAVTMAPPIRVSASLRSLRAAPETPPPIA
jgi:hypothetical protein